MMSGLLLGIVLSVSLSVCLHMLISQYGYFSFTTSLYDIIIIIALILLLLLLLPRVTLVD
jgi:hypothetical protein